jgi:biopolymer transport protein ExbB
MASNTRLLRILSIAAAMTLAGAAGGQPDDGGRAPDAPGGGPAADATVASSDEEAAPEAPGDQQAGAPASEVADDSGEEPASFREVAGSIDQRLRAAVDRLDRVRQEIAEQKIPLSRKLNELEQTLSDVREQFQEASRTLDTRTLDLSNLRKQIETREQQANYLSNQFSQYIREFETRLHIAEGQRYRDVLEEAKLAPENSKLSQREVYDAQTALIGASLERLHEGLGGTRFEGAAVDEEGMVQPGRFVLVGPAAVFASDDGSVVGLVEQRLGSTQPTVIPFENPADREAAGELVATGAGTLPFDPTLGNAHKMEAAEDTLLEHIYKGGPVMVPIFALAGASLLVAIYKWMALVFVRQPSRKKVDALMGAVARNDQGEAEKKVKPIKGPMGRMLEAGVQYMKEPRELIEEVMYEHVLSARLKLQRFLPFIAITAASAPLLGLLGTVVGIINTFKLITLFGTGDVQTLSGGISEALITTEFGLIVAIPSLLLHAFLSRKAKGVTDQMEKTAMTFANQVDIARARESRKAA